MNENHIYPDSRSFEPFGWVFDWICCLNPEALSCLERYMEAVGSNKIFSWTKNSLYENNIQFKNSWVAMLYCDSEKHFIAHLRCPSQIITNLTTNEPHPQFPLSKKPSKETDRIKLMRTKPEANLLPRFSDGHPHLWFGPAESQTTRRDTINA